MQNTQNNYKDTEAQPHNNKAAMLKYTFPFTAKIPIKLRHTCKTTNIKTASEHNTSPSSSNSITKGCTPSRLSNDFTSDEYLQTNCNCQNGSNSSSLNPMKTLKKRDKRIF